MIVRTAAYRQLLHRRPYAPQVTVDVNNTPLESTAVIVTTTPTLSVGNVKVIFEGEVAIVAVAGVTPTTDAERT